MQQKIEDEFQELLKHGNQVLRSGVFSRIDPRSRQLAATQYAEFKTRSLNLIRRAIGESSDHYLQIQHVAHENLPACLGIVDAALHDIESGLLFDSKAVIETELLGDFLDQARTLLAAGCHVPAASLAGAVLENMLRKLWEKKGRSLPVRTNINSLCSELVKSGDFNVLTQKQITTHADVRNKADHGHYYLFQNADVDDMIKWIERFSKENLR